VLHIIHPAWLRVKRRHMAKPELDQAELQRGRADAKRDIEAACPRLFWGDLVFGPACLSRAISRNMRVFIFIGILGYAALLVSCRRAPSPSTPSSSGQSQKSIEQRLSDLETSLNGGSTRPSEAELQKEAEHDLAEIRSMGLVDRALREFGERVPNAAIDSCRISYFVDTNTVWCSVRYKIPGKEDFEDDSFGYKRESGTNWVAFK
jgi:hypothetical protein